MKVRRVIKKIIKKPINRSVETTVELATQSRKSFVYYINLHVLGNFIILCVKWTVQIHNKNNTKHSCKSLTKSAISWTLV